ncbi:hypothetical protein [Lederbergia panacisoli]|uniref:hypothetical protein n=1 Tax=Lederbergia panacisoli TaxID=1255251 RepID=UPI00214AA7A9|nr:hypothetical protein [Lederbergia panacisoli]MCR2820556.1 hypothetical protein [Lederbergia panacisoli]
MIKNEKGHALIITLGIIVLIFLFAATLMIYTFNSRAEVKKSETYIQETEVAEMGITFFKENLNKALVQINEEISKDRNATLEDLKNRLSETLTKLNNKSWKITDNTHSYTLTVPPVTLDKNTNKITVTVNSIGKKSDESKGRLLTAKYELIGSIGGGNDGGSGGEGGNSNPAFEDSNDFKKIDNPSRLVFAYEETGDSKRFSNPLTLGPGTSITVKDNVLFEYNLVFGGTNLQVGNNAIFKDSTRFQPYSSLNIGNNAIFDLNADFQQDTKINIGGNALFNNAINIGERSEVNIGGALYSGKNIRFNNYSNTIIKGDAKIPAATFDQNSTLLVSGNFMMSEGATIEKNVMITIEKSASFTHISIGQGSILHIKGNLFSTRWHNVTGKICVEGKAFLGTNQPVITDKDVCPKNQPEGTIYVLGKDIKSEIPENPPTEITPPDEEIEYK